MSKASKSFRYAIVELPEDLSVCCRPGVIQLLPGATLEDAQTICEGLKAGRPAIVHEKMVRKAVFVGPNRGDTEDCWVPEFTYEVL